MSETKLFDVVLTNLNNVCSLEEERMMHLSSIFVNMRNKPLLGNYGVDPAAVHEKNYIIVRGFGMVSFVHIYF